MSATLACPACGKKSAATTLTRCGGSERIEVACSACGYESDSGEKSAMKATPTRPTPRPPQTTFTAPKSRAIVLTNREESLARRLGISASQYVDQLKATKLSDAERDVAAKCGISPEQFVEARDGEQLDPRLSEEEAEVARKCSVSPDDFVAARQRDEARRGDGSSDAKLNAWLKSLTAA